MSIERQYNGGFDVYLNDNLIDTVYYNRSTVDEVRRSLINHDGYDSRIEVVPPESGVIPLTDEQLESICDESDVRLVQVTEGKYFGWWHWLDDNGSVSGMNFETKREAMLNVVDVLMLDDGLGED